MLVRKLVPQFLSFFNRTWFTGAWPPSENLVRTIRFEILGYKFVKKASMNVNFGRYSGAEDY